MVRLGKLEMGPSAVGFGAVWVLLFLIAVGRIFLLQHTAPLAEFGDDGEYMHLAENILSGHQYGDLGLVIDPGFVRPREEMRSVYPVGYPAIVAAIWSVFPHSIFVLKVANVFFAFAAMVAMALLLGDLTGSAAIGLAISALWFLSPVTIESAEMVQSDLPFIAGLYWFIYAWQKFATHDSSLPGIALLAAAFGVGLLGIIDIRSVGIAIAPAILVEEILRRRSVPWVSGAVCLIAFLLLGIQSQLIVRPGPGYLGAFQGMTASDFFHSVMDNLQGDRWKLALALDPGTGKGPIGGLLSTSLIVLSLVAIVGYLRSRPPLIVLFFLAYFALIAVFPDDAAWARYLLPIIPILFALSVVGLELLMVRLPRYRAVAAWTLIASLSITTIAAEAQSALWRPVTIGYPTPGTQQMLDAVRARTGAHDVVAYFYPYLIAMKANRPTLRIWPQQVRALSAQELICRYARLGVKYVVLKSSPSRPVTRFYSWDHSDDLFLQRVVGRAPASFHDVFHNADFSLYRLDTSGVPACVDQPDLRSTQSKS